jgi:protein-ribulosamine 3-kinase
MSGPALEDALQIALDLRSEPRIAGEVSGGSINDARRYETERGPIFVKRGERAAYAMYAAEAAGLDTLARTQTVRTPRVLAVGEWERGAYLALEWIEFARADRSSEAVLGEQLAWMHRTTHAEFGWSRDNTIGATAQVNTPNADWVVFFREHRLRSQLHLAAKNGAGAKLCADGARLCEALDAFFTSYRPAPSLLHGDLWGGNWGADADGLPVVFDPAVYFGDREADVAMTRLFGGFGAAFYAAYRSTWAPDAGAAVRTTLYNLYHVLNHFNLFGGGYAKE